MSSVGGGGGIKGEEKGADGTRDTKNLKSIGGIKPGGRFSSSFIVVRGDAGWKVKHRRFTLWCIFSCENVISMQLLLENWKGVYTIIST